MRLSTLFAVLAGCSASPSPQETLPMRPERESELVSCFREIAASIGDLTAPAELYAFPCYRAYLEAPGQPSAELAAIIASREYSPLIREIAAYAAHKLGPTALATLGTQLLPRLDAGEVSPALVEKVFVPGNQWSTTAAEHHDDPSLRPVLEALSGSSHMPPDLTDYLRTEILTGEAKRHVQILREHGQLGRSR